MANEVTMEFQGNFFNHRNIKFAKALNDSLEEIAAIGSGKVSDQLVRGHGFRTGYLKSAVGGGLIKNLHAQIDAGAHRYGRNVVYASWVEGVSSRNKRSRFKGYFMFKKIFLELRKQPKWAEDIMKFNIKRHLN